MQNDTSVEPWTNSTGPVLESPSMSLIILLSTLVLWIIFVNCLVLGCLLFSRHALKNFVNLQILSFSFTDILVGFSSILMIMTYPLTKAFPYFEACAAIFYSFGVSQSATLYHALGICIHRFVTIKRISGSNGINSRGMYKKILMQVSLTWIACIIITAIPFIAFGRFGKPLGECSLHHIFQDKYMAYIIFFNIFFITPQIGMTVIYIDMFRFLIRKRKRINIIPVNTRPPGYKTFFVLNSVEHEILNAHKYKNIKKFGLFKAQLSLECYFSRPYMLKCQQLLAF